MIDSFRLRLKVVIFSNKKEENVANITLYFLFKPTQWCVIFLPI